MRLSPLFAALGLLLTVPFGYVQAADVSFTRFRGGGPARTDCMLVTDEAGVPSHPGAPATSCRDGDPACDADATANGIMP